MKSFLLTLSFLAVLHSQGKTQKFDSSRFTRQKLLSELTKFKIAFASTDKMVTKKYFRSLINDSVLQSISKNASLDSDDYNPGTLINRRMVDENFVNIYRDLNMNQFKKLFHYMSIDSLSFKDMINYEKHYQNQGCYYVYEISIDKNDVQIIYGTNSNEDYADRHPNLPAVCGEHSYIWTFLFDGKRLYFKKLIEAD
jgi:hypothetical protein